MARKRPALTGAVSQASGSAKKTRRKQGRTEQAFEVQRAPAERGVHGSELVVEAGTQRILGPLLSLHRAGDIGNAHLAAADRWHRDWVMGVEGARDPEAMSSGQAPDLHVAMLSRVAAAARCSEVRRCLGASAEYRLRLLLVEELSFTTIGQLVMPGDAGARKKVAAQSAMLLDMLAEHYASVAPRH